VVDRAEICVILLLILVVSTVLPCSCFDGALLRLCGSVLLPVSLSDDQMTVVVDLFRSGRRVEGVADAVTRSLHRRFLLLLKLSDFGSLGRHGQPYNND
jgi:hypothetical protein